MSESQQEVRYHWDKTRIVWRVIDGELYLLDITTGYHFSLNHVGQAIWVEMDSGKSREEITRLIAEKYQITPDIVSHDLAELIQELLRENILEEKHG